MILTSRPALVAGLDVAAETTGLDRLVAAEAACSMMSGSSRPANFVGDRLGNVRGPAGVVQGDRAWTSPSRRTCPTGCGDRRRHQPAESKLVNLGHLGDRNDHDSLGLFQQRPTSGWGSPEQITDPTYFTRAFLAGLKQVDGWEKMAADLVLATYHTGPYADIK